MIPKHYLWLGARRDTRTLDSIGGALRERNGVAPSMVGFQTVRGEHQCDSFEAPKLQDSLGNMLAKLAKALRIVVAP